MKGFFHFYTLSFNTRCIIADICEKNLNSFSYTIKLIKVVGNFLSTGSLRGIQNLSDEHYWGHRTVRAKNELKSHVWFWKKKHPKSITFIRVIRCVTQVTRLMPIKQFECCEHHLGLNFLIYPIFDRTFNSSNSLIKKGDDNSHFFSFRF